MAIFITPSSNSLQASSVAHTTSSIGAGSSEDFTISAGDIFHLLSITASTPCWIRVYGTSEARNADTRTNPGGTVPDAGSDFYAEVATVSSSQTIRFSPVPLVQGTNGNAFIRIKNTDSASRIITLNFSVLTLEN